MDEYIKKSDVIKIMEANSHLVKVYGAERKMIDAIMMGQDLADLKTIGIARKKGQKYENYFRDHSGVLYSENRNDCRGTKEERLTEISNLGDAYFPECFKEPCLGDACRDDKCNLIDRVCEKLASYENIGTPKELKNLKENGAFTGLELAKMLAILKEWKSYTDAEERGLLARLPCKIGDMVYVPTRSFISELRITKISIDIHGTYFRWMLDSGIYPNLDGFSGHELGKTVFLACDEAEKKLEEMKNDRK